LGLNPSEHSSGGRQKFGTISKQGNRLVRALLVEAAQTAARVEPTLRRQYDKPSNSHVAGTDHDEFGKIFRRNMRKGTANGEQTLRITPERASSPERSQKAQACLLSGS
jgi:hypothetical protein